MFRPRLFAARLFVRPHFGPRREEPRAPLGGLADADAAWAERVREDDEDVLVLITLMASEL